MGATVAAVVVVVVVCVSMLGKRVHTRWIHTHTDALCGNTLLIAVDELVSEGLLDESDKPAKLPVDEVDFLAVAKIKEPLLTKAADRLLQEPKFKYLKEQMTQFRYVEYGVVCMVLCGGGVRASLSALRAWLRCYVVASLCDHHHIAHPFNHPREDNPWIEDSALFDVLSALPEHDELCWWEWDTPLRQRDPDALQAVREQYDQQIQRFIAKQFLFDRQWKVVKVGWWVGSYTCCVAQCVPVCVQLCV